MRIKVGERVRLPFGALGRSNVPNKDRGAPSSEGSLACIKTTHRSALAIASVEGADRKTKNPELPQISLDGYERKRKPGATSAQVAH